MSFAARVRLVLARSPWLYWSIVLAVAAGAGLLVVRAAAGVDAARESWGATSRVAVAVADIGPGDPLAGAVELRDLPVPVVPAAALTSVEPDAVARQRLAAGEVLVAHDVSARAGPQQLIPAGWLAVAVAETAPSGAVVGDAVSVASGGIVVAADGIVVGLGAEALLVAVPAEHAALVAQATATGDVALLLKP